eukprot:6194072-Pleurochrysis_carterae.AAC.1
MRALLCEGKDDAATLRARCQRFADGINQMVANPVLRIHPGPLLQSTCRKLSPPLLLSMWTSRCALQETFRSSRRLTTCRLTRRPFDASVRVINFGPSAHLL